MHLSILHTTRYDYDEPVRPLPHLAYLQPRSGARLTLKSFSLRTSPTASCRWQNDDLNNVCASLEFSEASSTLEIVAESVVETADTSPFDFSVRDYALELPFSYEPLHADNLAPGRARPTAEMSRQVAEFLQDAFPVAPTNTVEWLFRLAGFFPSYFGYERRVEEGIRSPGDTFSRKTGSCRDLAAVYIACARFAGIAARFVSGYHFDQQVAADAGDMHAWVEVYLPGAGWIGVDPTMGAFCDGAYVPVAHAFVSQSVNPLQGSWVGRRGVGSRLSTRLTVTQQGSYEPLPPTAPSDVGVLESE